MSAITPSDAGSQLIDALLSVDSALAVLSSTMGEALHSESGISHANAQHLVKHLGLQLTKFATRHDVVLTITQDPVEPLAMGHYMPRVDVRASNDLYRGRLGEKWK
ncbi:hypothetical protein [Paraburkholderia sp. BCC1886]|uniref:hypothetical protein n=1 Tax=Paraburkholderia sp. BCC1886 TaxID=2562670 RepID=UPI00118415B5|nr:hypothetical protein [Paraburkholderia sp. BCC1886]